MPQTGYTFTATTTRPNDTAPYAIGDVIGQSPAANLVFTAAGAPPGANLLITLAEIQTIQASIPSGLGAKRLHLFSRPPTAIADNAAFDVVAADRPFHLGFIDMPAPVQLGSVHLSQTINPFAMQIVLDPDQNRFWAALQTLGAYTPSALIVRNLSITTIEI
jgi:hypothetical protein